MPVLANKRCSSLIASNTSGVGHAVNRVSSWSGSPRVTASASTSYSPAPAHTRVPPSNAYASSRSIAPLVDFTPPRSWGGNSTWLADCVPAIVRESRARKAPFLHLVSTRSKLRDQHGISIPASVQAWSSIQSRISSSGSDALVLVRPIELPSVVQACASAADGRSAASADVATGIVGEDCCDDASQHGAHSMVPVSVAGTSDQQHQHAHHHSSVAGTSSPPAPEYFGLVVQSTPSTPACYVLKTSSSEEVVGCTCVHYSLTRIAQDQPLWRQVMEAWRG